jgi:hypothetical protein
MTPQDFKIWLTGFLDSLGIDIPTSNQIKLIKDKLDSVHVIPQMNLPFTAPYTWPDEIKPSCWPDALDQVTTKNRVNPTPTEDYSPEIFSPPYKNASLPPEEFKKRFY